MSGVEGVIVLERCSVELDPDEHGNLYSFVIGMFSYLASVTEKFLALI